MNFVLVFDNFISSSSGLFNISHKNDVNLFVVCKTQHIITTMSYFIPSIKTRETMLDGYKFVTGWVTVGLFLGNPFTGIGFAAVNEFVEEIFDAQIEKLKIEEKERVEKERAEKERMEHEREYDEWLKKMGREYAEKIHNENQ